VTHTDQGRQHLPLYQLEELKDITNDKAKVREWIQLLYILCGISVNSSGIQHQVTELMNKELEEM
jgi:hypothetical protein